MNGHSDTKQRAARIPACTVYEEGDEVIAKVEMPGVSKEGLEIKVDGNELSILGTRRDENIRGAYLLRERRIESYRKLFTIDETIAREKIEASLENGILTLKLQVKEAAKPRKIEVS